jgi:hypothetical protein
LSSGFPAAHLLSLGFLGLGQSLGGSATLSTGQLDFHLGLGLALAASGANWSFFHFFLALATAHARSLLSFGGQASFATLGGCSATLFAVQDRSPGFGQHLGCFRQEFLGLGCHFDSAGQNTESFNLGHDDYLSVCQQEPFLL